MASLHELPLKRILVMRPDNLGDVVLLTPALRTLAEHFPQARLTLLASPAGAAVAPLIPELDAVWVHRALWQDLQARPFEPEAELGFIDALRERAFDAAFLFTSFSQSPYAPAYACYLAGIPVRVGQARDFGGAVLTHWVQPAADGLHQAERNLHMLASVGLAARSRKLALQVPAEARTQARTTLGHAGVRAGDPFICLAPGASCAARRYPAERYAEVVRRLVRQTGLPVVVVGTAREQALVAEVAGSQGVALAGMLDVPALTAVIDDAALVVANDSGCMHLADACGKPQVVLFSGTELESQWRPRRSPAILLRRPTSCTPCYGFQCRYALECLDIPPSEVESAVVLMLRRAGIAARSAVA